MIRHYVAVIEGPAPGEHGGYSVFFPDLDGCTSAGDSLQEAAVNAEEALRGHVGLMLEAGETIPSPRPLDAIESDPETPEAARVLVPVELSRKAVRLNITMEQGLVARIDRAAADAGLTRSGFLAEAARRILAGRPAPARRPERRARAR